jgi:hypothetical protein
VLPRTHPPCPQGRHGPCGSHTGRLRLLTLRHEEGDAEPALQHTLPQGRQVGPIKGKRATDQDVQHDTEALRTTKQPMSVPSRLQDTSSGSRVHMLRLLPRCPAGGLRTPSPQRLQGRHMGGSHTTWTGALLPCRSSQIQNLQGKEAADSTA